jgi:PAS domain S-box-containing protein
MGAPGGVRWTLILGALAIVGGYLAASLGYLLTLRPAGVVFLWPPSGLMLGVLVLVDRRAWPALLVGSLVGNVGTDLQHGASIPLALAGSAANALEQLVGAHTLQRLCGRRVHLGSRRDVGALLTVIIGTNALTALVGAAVLVNYGTPTFWSAWFNWWTGDGMGMLIVTPVVLTWAHAVRTRDALTIRRAVEAAGSIAAVLVLAAYLLAPGDASVQALESHAYLVFPLVIWSGVRFGPWGSATAALALTFVAAWFGVQGDLPFDRVGRPPSAQVLEVYSYLALAAITSLIPAAILSERVDTERELRESESRFRQIAEYVNEAFFVVDLASRRTLYVSPSWATIWQRPLEEGYDPQLWFEAIHPDDRVAMQRAMEANARGEVTTTRFRIRRPDGSIRWLKGRAFPVHDPSGAVYRVVGVTADVTDLRESEDRFHQAQKMEAVGRLAGGVAHDFNNLLTVILMETDVLDSTPGVAPEARESIGEVRRATQSAAALTRQLLAFSRRQIIEPRVFDLNAAVDDTSKMLRRLIGEDIRLDARLAPGPLGVLADRGQIEQVLTNLAVNARDAMPRGGTLTVRTSVEHSNPGDVTLEVSDTGGGMDAEVLAHAFEPFYTTKEMGRGTGLGLATCHGIVTQAGGRIEIISAIGVGTTVLVVLPRVELPAEPTAEPTATAFPRGDESILLVEDETGVRQVTARILRAQGYQVLEARDGADALRQLAVHRTPVDLLLTDIILPGMSGRELAERIHDTRPEIPTLFASGYSDDVVLQERLIAHDAAFLPKPFTKESLVRRVRDLLDARAPRARRD